MSNNELAPSSKLYCSSEPAKEKLEALQSHTRSNRVQTTQKNLWEPPMFNHAY